MKGVPSVRPTGKLAVVFAVALGCFSIADAAIQLNFVYYPNEDLTRAYYSGTWDVSSTIDYSSVPGMTTTSATMFVSLYDGTELTNVGMYDGGIASGGAFAWNGTVVLPNDWGASAGPHGTRISGDPFGFNTTAAFGPFGFTSHTMITGVVEYSVGVDLSDLGFDATEIANGGSYSGPAGTVNWTASVAVPEPAAYAQLLGGFALVLGLGRRRR